MVNIFNLSPYKYDQCIAGNLCRRSCCESSKFLPARNVCNLYFSVNHWHYISMPLIFPHGCYSWCHNRVCACSFHFRSYDLRMPWELAYLKGLFVEESHCRTREGNPKDPFAVTSVNDNEYEFSHASLIFAGTSSCKLSLFAKSFRSQSFPLSTMHCGPGQYCELGLLHFLNRV